MILPNFPTNPTHSKTKEILTSFKYSISAESIISFKRILSVFKTVNISRSEKLKKLFVRLTAAEQNALDVYTLTVVARHGIKDNAFFLKIDTYYGV